MLYTIYYILCVETKRETTREMSPVLVLVLESRHTSTDPACQRILIQRTIGSIVRTACVEMMNTEPTLSLL